MLVRVEDLAVSRESFEKSLPQSIHGMKNVEHKAECDDQVDRTQKACRKTKRIS